MNKIVLQVLDKLSMQGQQLYITPQNLIEFFAVATRDVSMNGLGMSPLDAYQVMTNMEKLFSLLPDREEIFTEWRRLVVAYGILGLNVHDARLVAVMLTYGITHLLTFDLKDFQVYKNILAISPKTLLHG